VHARLAELVLHEVLAIGKHGDVIPAHPVFELFFSLAGDGAPGGVALLKTYD